MAAPAMDPARPAHPAWHPLVRVAFRFAFCYLGLYSLVTFSNIEERLPYEKLWHTIVPWVGAHVLHLAKPITYFPSGSGDKTSDWVLLFCHLAISLVATVVWSIFDRRQEYGTLNEWLRVVLRYAVGWTMISYGSFKVVKLQFSDSRLGQLLEPLRDVSPMGLLWTFMGYSTPYTFFAGACEMIGGVLLFFRRTATLGALVSAAVMFNVAMLNYAYDVPVKLLATHLVLMSAYVAIPDLRAMCDFFVRNRPAAPAPVRPHFTSRKARLAGIVAKVLLLGYIAVSGTITVVQQSSQFGAGAPKSPLYGIWDVEEFTRDGAVLPPLTTDGVRWRRFISDVPQFFSVRIMDDSAHGYRVKMDLAKSTIVNDGGKTPLSLAWSRDGGHLALNGTLDGHQVTMRLKKMDLSHTNLLGRGFHWVSELPFNR